MYPDPERDQSPAVPPGAGHRYAEHLERFPERELEAPSAAASRALTRAIQRMRELLTRRRQRDAEQQPGEKKVK